MKDPLLARFESRLDAAVSAARLPLVPADLLDVLRYALLGGGKRVRPLLCLHACEASGGDPETAMPAALAIETLHNYTLVHDDLPCMDDDLLRRGRPTVHAKFGYAQAVLAGDALQALAFDFLRDLRVSPSAFRAALAVLADRAGPGGVVGGQWVDVTAAPPHGADRIAYVHQHKTADLFEGAAALGAMASGQRTWRSSTAILTRFATDLGIAFQIADDILDETERQAKSPAERELSCLDVWSMAEARARLTSHTEAALAALDGLPGDTAPLRALALALLRRKS